MLLQLTTFTLSDAHDIYRGVRGIDWPAVFPLEATFAVRATLANSSLRHSGFAAQRVKDAVVDAFREACGARPSVDKVEPAVRVHLHVQRTRASVSLDLAGEALHRRSYRPPGAPAPLKENLAAAILSLAGWPAIAARGGTLLDPMCGSGTLLIEGAMMAANVAPGLHRESFGFLAWHGHRQALWSRLLAEARSARGPAPAVVGYDVDSAALRMVRDAAQRIGLDDVVTVHKRSLDGHAGTGDLTPGLVLSNPPYGERLGEQSELPGLYRQFGQMLRHYPGWHAALFTGNADLVHRVRMRSVARHKLNNGAIACTLFDFGEIERSAAAAAPLGDVADDDAFANRLRKNLRHVRRWARREQVECYRLYDADIPEYAFAIDFYGGEPPHVQIQEYVAPQSVPVDQAAQRRDRVLAATADLLETPTACLHFKSRRRQRGAAQYSRQADRARFDVVHEHGLRFYVNFGDYLDTGLFLHHRLTRRLIRDSVAGRSFLNLFAYTGTATVSAAAGGASSTVSVDLSPTYLGWAGENLALNGLQGDPHQLLRADCLVWLDEAARAARRWDRIFLDPPSFSNSKSMRSTLDVQRDHRALIEAAARLLAPDGILWFATNKRRFKLDPSLQTAFALRDLSAQTTPPDFNRRPAHRCWEIRNR